MMAVQQTTFEKFISEYDAAAWERALAGVRGEIHEVDRNATEIWFRFYPLALHEFLANAGDADQLAKRLLLEGNYRLENQIHSSHRFLYGHRFWAEAKRTTEQHANSHDAPRQSELADLIRILNREVASAAKQDAALTLGITFVALMTLRQVGLERFAAALAEIMLDRAQLKKTPEGILRERAKTDGQGLLGFLRTEDKKWTVTFDEHAPDAKFKVINAEELASGAARDTRDWRAVDPRCSEGAIPVQCRAAACGTCWVGVLGGAERLTPVSRLEGAKIKEFGYIDTAEARPLIRLACMAQATGAVSIVIPTWNGFFGKAVGRKSEGQQV